MCVRAYIESHTHTCLLNTYIHMHVNTCFCSIKKNTRKRGKLFTSNDVQGILKHTRNHNCLRGHPTYTPHGHARRNTLYTRTCTHTHITHTHKVSQPIWERQQLINQLYLYGEKAFLCRGARRSGWRAYDEIHTNFLRRLYGMQKLMFRKKLAENNQYLKYLKIWHTTVDGEQPCPEEFSNKFRGVHWFLYKIYKILQWISA